MGWQDRHYNRAGFGQSGGGMGDTRPLMVAIGALVALHVLRVIMAAATKTDSSFAFEIFGIWWPGLSSGYLWQPLTYQVMHGGVGHLLFNCLGLFLFGRIALMLVSWQRLAGITITAAALAGLVSAGFDRMMVSEIAPVLPTVGASGTILAILGVCLILAPNLELNLLLFTARLKYVVGFYVLLDVLYLLGDGSGKVGNHGTSYTTHLAGFAFGCLFTRFGASWIDPKLAAVAGKFRNVREARQRRVEVARFMKEQEIEFEKDRILGKIGAGGMASLTDEERAFLAKVSRQAQEERSPRR